MLNRDYQDMLRCLQEEQVVSHAEHIDFGEVTMPVLALDDLLKNKLATGRPKDLEDAKLLQQRRSSAR